MSGGRSPQHFKQALASGENPELTHYVDSEAELEERRRLDFEKGAVECWVCDLFGCRTFCDPAGELEQSRLCPKFPARIRLPAIKRPKRRRWTAGA